MPRTKSNPSTNGKRPSMYDVARLAGVSQTTVSFVVNNVVSANIATETRDRVWAAVKQLGWRPNAMARGLRTRLSRTIGLISDEVVTSPHAVKIIQGAQDTAWAHENMLLVVNTGGKLILVDAGVGDDEMLGREHLQALMPAEDLAGERVERGQLLDLVAEESDADGGIVVGRPQLDGIAAHAEAPAVEIEVAALVLDIEQPAQQDLPRQLLPAPCVQEWVRNPLPGSGTIT